MLSYLNVSNLSNILFFDIIFFMNLHPAQIKVPIPVKDKQPRYKSHAHILLIALNLGLSNFYFGYSLVYISTLEFTQIIKIFSITMSAYTAKGILTGCIPLGACFGALLARKLIHVFSRRKFVLLINFVAVIAGCVLYVNNFIVLICMRIIQGICVGLYTSIVPLYISEISPVEIQSSTGPFTQIFCSLGTTIGYLFYLILSLTLTGQQNQLLIWYLVIGFPFIPIIIQTIVLLFVFPYETPKYHLLHHQKKKAKSLIALIYKQEYVETVYHEKIEDLEFSKIKQTVKQTLNAPAEKPGVPVPTLRLVSRSSLSSGSFSGVEIAQPITPKIAIFAAIHCMILRQFTGINAVVAYGGDIIAEAAANLRSIVPCFLNLEIMIGSFAAIWIMHKFGKKTLLQIGTITLASSLLLITIGFFILDSNHEVAFIIILLGLIVFTFTFGATYGAIIWAYVSQIVEPSYDILATTVTWIFATIVIVLFPILKGIIFGGNPAVLFLFFFAWMAVSYFVNRKVLVQTRNKGEHQIRQEYNDMKCQLTPCCAKKKHDGPEMTQSQLFDLNTIELKLAKLRKEKEEKQKNKFKSKQKQQKQKQRTNSEEGNEIYLKFKQNHKKYQLSETRASPQIETTFDRLNSSKESNPQSKEEKWHKKEIHR